MAEIKLDDKVTIVTGAGGGMGRVMALSLAEAGALVIAVDISSKALKDLTEGAEALGLDSRILPIVTDLGDREACEAVVPKTLTKTGGLHLLVNNAGVGMQAIDPDYSVRPVRFWEADPDRWEYLMNLNVRAPLLLARSAVPEFLEQGWGRIINVTTSLDTMIRPTLSAYGQSKAALEAASASWARELEGTGVTVNVLVPGGPTNTAFLPENTTFPRDKLIQPEVMGPPIRWLASTESDGFTNRRVIARDWDESLPPADAAKHASAPAAWAGWGPQAARPDQQ